MANLPSILFMGTPDFALYSLKALHHHGYPIKAVFSQPDRPKGRGKKLNSPPCAEFAKENDIPLYQPIHVKDDETIKIIKNINPDFIVVAAYGLFLPQKLIDLAQIDTVNVHASLLPEYRGAAPINQAIYDGKKTIGVSIMKVELKMDSGAVYSQASIPIENKDTTFSLTEKLASLGANLLLETLPKIKENNLKPIPQNEDLVSIAPKLTKEDAKINWNKSAIQIERMIRAYYPWPGSFTFIEGKRLKIFDGEIFKDEVNKKPGEIYLISEKGIFVKCGKDSLCIKEVQLEGKSKTSAIDFARGFRLTTDHHFSYE
jgi:methionyl-tRNA formyltransferase